jgi:hypothetical protein
MVLRRVFFYRKHLFIFLLYGLIVTCSSDRQGDEIGTVKNSNFPENYDVRKNEIFIASNIKGPEDRTKTPDRNPTSWRKYSSGSESRLAILLTDSGSSWLGLAHGLKTIGVPFLITDDYRKAIQHDVVLVYPVISGATLSADALQALANVPRTGHTLIGTQVLGGLNEIFGFEDPIPSKQHFEIKIQTENESSITTEFTDPKELEISLGNKEKFKETIGTYSYSKTQLPALAVYEDKTTAISQKFYENGRAYAFGFDIGYFILKGHNIRHEDFNRAPNNNFEPTIDVLLRMLKNMYLEGEKDAAYITTVPYNRSLSVCITHNINFKKALASAADIAKKEKALGVHSSWFIQTKYIRDKSEPIFFSNDDFKKLKSLIDAGMDLQSNSVSGSSLFDQFEQGTGDEVYPDYRPYVMATEKTYHGTIYGEMRVSRFLIDRFAPGSNVTAFRSSHLYTPFTYPQNLLASGYRFSSSVPANAALTHFPYQMNYNREYDEELECFSFPVTDDDEIPPYSVNRASNAISLAKKIARYGGCFIGQVHPNATGWEVEKKFIDAMRDEAWFGSIRDFGLWWTARNEITLDVIQSGDHRVVTVNVPKRMEGLAIMMPIRSTPIAVEGGGRYSVDGKLIIFELAEGVIRITLDN